MKVLIAIILILPLLISCKTTGEKEVDKGLVIQSGAQLCEREPDHEFCNLEEWDNEPPSSR